MYAAAHTDDGTFGALELIDHLFDLYRMSRHSRLVGPQVHILRIGEVAHGLLLDIDGQIDQDRASAACIGDVESLLDDPGNICCIPDNIAVFNE